LLLGYVGAFDGLEATTHFLALDTLRQICADYVKRTAGAMGTTVLPASSAATGEEKPKSVRYVDAGLNASEVHVISSGGISCGIDASLYLLGMKLGRGKAVTVAGMMEYAWREM